MSTTMLSSLLVLLVPALVVGFAFLEEADAALASIMPKSTISCSEDPDEAI